MAFTLNDLYFYHYSLYTVALVSTGAPTLMPVPGHSGATVLAEAGFTGGGELNTAPLTVGRHGAGNPAPIGSYVDIVAATKRQGQTWLVVQLWNDGTNDYVELMSSAATGSTSQGPVGYALVPTASVVLA